MPIYEPSSNLSKMPYLSLRKTYSTYNEMLVKAYTIIPAAILCFSALTLRSQGLLFKSEDSLLTQRTSFHVFDSHPPVFHDHFYIEFDLSLWDNANLGYVLDVADKGNANSYSLSYLYNNGAGVLNFNIDCKSNKLVIPLPATLLRKKSWFRVRLDFNLQSDNVAIDVDNTVYLAEHLGFKPDMTPNIIFGKNQLYTEVPNMVIRDLAVGDDNKKYYFPLNEWNGTVVHDSAGAALGTVENPVWLINESFFWKPVYSHASMEVAGLNFNPLDQDLFIFTHDSLITYDPDLRGVTYSAYANPMPVPMVLGKSIFNPRQKKVYSYELFDIPKGQASIAALDMGSSGGGGGNSGSLRWTTIGKVNLPFQLHHHNIFYDSREDQIYLFGGYGSYSYHNSFLKYDDTTDQWEKVAFKGDVITPRFFSATGPSDKPNEMFLFGGYGNESGSQVVGGRQYYDLYRIDLTTHTVRKCWTISPPDSGVFVPANNLVLSKDKQYFYALCYPHEVARTELKLYRFSVADGSYTIVSAPIPVASMRIETDINLFYRAKTDEFLCTVQEFTDRQRSVIKVYSLAGPPVTTAQYLASLHPPVKPGRAWAWLVVAGFVLGGGGLGVVLWRRAPTPKASAPKGAALKGVDAVEIPILPEVDEKIALDEEPIMEQENDRNAVYLMGEFVAYDRNGHDITHLFSPKIKQLFVLILLHSMDGKGIGSKKISSKLWPEKEPAKTKNIKGVTFNHLRNIIADIDGIELVFQDDHYHFRFGDGFCCDFCVLTGVMRSDAPSGPSGLSGPASSAAPAVDNAGGWILQLIARGPLLADMPESLVDDIRASFEERLTGLLIPEMIKRYDARDFKLALEIAKLILTMDCFNEEALKYQVKSCRRLKGIDYSRKAYEQFTQGYEKSLGVAYHVSFDAIVS